MSSTPEPEDTGSEPGGELVPFPRQPADPAPDMPAAASDTSFEVELDDEPAAKPEPVDAGEGIVLPDPDGEHYPVIPEHLRSLAGIGEALARHGRRVGHRASFHGIRAPRYLLLAVVYAVAGVFRLTGRQLNWWWLSGARLPALPRGGQRGLAGVDETAPRGQGHPPGPRHHAGRGSVRAAAGHLGPDAVRALVGLAPGARGGAARAGPRRAARRPADHLPGHDRAAVPGAQRRRGAARLLRRRARPPRQARPAGRIRVGDDPGRRGVAGEGDPALRGRVRRRGQGQGRPGLGPGRGPLAGVPDPGQDQPPPPHAVGGRPGPAGHPRGPHAAAGRQAPLDLAARPVRAGRAGPQGHAAAAVDLDPGRRAAAQGQDVQRPSAGPVRRARPFRAALGGGREELPGLERVPEDRLPLHPRHRAEPGRGPGSAAHRRADRDQAATSRTPTTSWPRCRWPSAPKAS